jgi:kynureninase
LGRTLTQALDEWRERLAGGWDDWIDLPASVGDRLGRLLGAGPGQVLVCDSTTVNLYKLASAALVARPDRSGIVGLAGEFPTDRYVLQGLAASAGRRLQLVEATDDPGTTEERIAAAVDGDTALVCVSHVDFRTGRRLDGARLTAHAHARGALILWDLAHSAGSVPVDLDGWDADLAVGCTYKYLNAGPGAPGFLYVADRLSRAVRQPIWGWFGQADQFKMGARYEPAAGVTSFLTGTPYITGLKMVDSALAVTEEAGVEALWAKSVGLTGLLIEQADARLAGHGAVVVTPRQPEGRGAHVSIGHPKAWSWCRALIDRGKVVGDFRPPDLIRLGPAPLYTRFVDCYDAVEAMAATMEEGIPEAPGRKVT